MKCEMHIEISAEGNEEALQVLSKLVPLIKQLPEFQLHIEVRT